MDPFFCVLCGREHTSAACYPAGGAHGQPITATEVDVLREQLRCANLQVKELQNNPLIEIRPDGKVRGHNCAGCEGLEKELEESNRLNGEFRRALDYISSCDESGICECAEHAKKILSQYPEDQQSQRPVCECGHDRVLSHGSGWGSCIQTNCPCTKFAEKREGRS